MIELLLLPFLVAIVFVLIKPAPDPEPDFDPEEEIRRIQSWFKT